MDIALLKVVKVLQNKDRMRNCHSPEETEDMCWPNTRWYLELASRTDKKDIGGQNGKTQIKSEV